MADMKGICVNHDCSRFEYTVDVSNNVEVAETERCSDCGQLLCHESGLTFRDALNIGSKKVESC